MRSNIGKSSAPVPLSLRNSKTELDRIARTMDHDAISDNIYKGVLISINDLSDPYHGQEEFEVRYALRVLYHNKCAYCESISFKADVEHYRPKKRVTRPNGNSTGYYWLCYEWSNLLPACFECNSRSGKWNKFPISGTRQTTPPLYASGKLNFNKCHAGKSPLTNERAHLFHPEIDRPEPYIKLGWDGKLDGMGRQSSRFKSTIKICDLNRANLSYPRKKIIDHYANEFERIFMMFRQNLINGAALEYMLDERLKDINTATDVKKPFSIVSIYIKNHFDQFVNNCMPQLANLEKQVLVSRFGIVNP